MSYYFSKVVSLSFDEAVNRVTEELKKEGFGIITQTNATETLKSKLNVDFRKYRVLGACHPSFDYRAVQAEEHFGLLMPCNILVQETPSGKVEVSAIDPFASFKVAGNRALEPIAREARVNLKAAVDAL